MNAFVQHLLFEFRSGMRHKQLLLMNYLFPLGFYLLMGVIMVEINPAFQQDLIPAMVVFAILASTMMGVPIGLVTAREKGILRSFKIYGVPARAILALPSLTTALHLLLVTALVAVTAPLFFGAPSPAHWAGFLMVFAAATFSCLGLSVLIGVISPNTSIAIMWAQLVFVLSTLLGGLMIPNQMLPVLIGKLSRLLPATHAMNAFNYYAMGEEAAFSPAGAVTVLLVGGALAFGLAHFLFNWGQLSPKQRSRNRVGLLALLPYILSIFLFG